MRWGGGKQLGRWRPTGWGVAQKDRCLDVGKEERVDVRVKIVTTLISCPNQKGPRGANGIIKE